MPVTKIGTPQDWDALGLPRATVIFGTQHGKKPAPSQQSATQPTPSGQTATESASSDKPEPLDTAATDKKTGTTGKKTQAARVIYKGSVADTDPRYQSGWNFLTDKNLAPPRPTKEPLSPAPANKKP